MNWSKSIIILVVVYGVLAFAYSAVNPLHEATDELRHYRYVRVIATTGSLPVQGEEPCRSQSHHPPLFYVLGAAATAWIDTGRDVCASPPENPFWGYRYWEVGADNKNLYLHGDGEAFPWTGEALAVHLIRVLNIFVGAGVLLLTYATGRVIWPRKPWIGLGAAGIVAFNPMFLYLAGAINNDIIAALSGAGIVYALARLLAAGRPPGARWGVILGAVYALALLSKFNLSASALLVEAILIWSIWRPALPENAAEGPHKEEQVFSPLIHRSYHPLVRWLIVHGAFLATVAILAGWWFVRNQNLYGEPTGIQRLTELWGVRDPWDSFGLAISELPYAWSTFWGRFGYGQIPLPQVFYDGFKVVCALGLAGAVWGFARYASKERRLSLLLLLANLVLFIGVLFNYMLISPAGPNGRFVFPALSSLGLLLSYGLWIWTCQIRIWIYRRHRAKLQKGTGLLGAALSLFLNLGLGVISIGVLADYLAPAYARPPAIDSTVEPPHKSDVRFDQLITLLGYQLDAAVAHPGETIEVKLYWEVNAQPPGDYLTFLHLMDEAGTMVAQRDTHPGTGNYPTSQWRPGDRFVDTIQMTIPETAYVPAEANLTVGFYAPGAYRLAIFDERSEPIGDAFTLSAIDLRPLSSSFPNEQDQNFENQVRLVGYEYDRRLVTPGEEVVVTLYWEILTESPLDLHIEAVAMHEDGHIVGPVNEPVSAEGAKGQDAIEGNTFKTVHILPLAPDVARGSYQLEIAVVQREGGRRLNIVAEDGHWIDSQLTLAAFRVVQAGES